MNYIDLRNIHYKKSRQLFKSNGEDMDNWLIYPYSSLKARFYIELSVMLVLFLQNTKVAPNHLTLIYALSGVVGGILLALPSDTSVFLGLLVFFLKGVLDWSDGLLARLTNRCSAEGAVLDPWGALVNSFGFLIGIGFFIFNNTNDITYIYLLVFILAVRCTDLRRYTYNEFMFKLVGNGSSVIERVKYNAPKVLTSNNNQSLTGMHKISRFIRNFLDDRARSVDFVCLVIFLEMYNDFIVFSPIIYWLYAVKFLILFLAGSYDVYINKLPSRLQNSFSIYYVNDPQKEKKI